MAQAKVDMPDVLTDEEMRRYEQAPSVLTDDEINRLEHGNAPSQNDAPEVLTDDEISAFEQNQGPQKTGIEPIVEAAKGVLRSGAAKGAVDFLSTGGLSPTSILAQAAESEYGKRVSQGIASGGLGSAGSMAGAVPAVEAFAGVRTPVGSAAQKTSDALSKLSQELQPNDPDFSDKLASGVGSMATFMIPGVGTAELTAQLPRLGVMAAKLAPAIQTGVSTILESATEAGGVYQDMVKQGIKPEVASKAAFHDFMGNVVLVGVTNRFGVFGDKLKGLKKALASSSLEGIQEAGQTILQSVTEGKPIDWVSVAESAGIGAIIGAGAGAIQGTTINRETLGDKASEYLASTMPALAEKIDNQTFPIEKGVVTEVIKKAAAAAEEVTIRGGTPEQADAASVAKFDEEIKKAMPETLPDTTAEQENSFPARFGSLDAIPDKATEQAKETPPQAPPKAIEDVTQGVRIDVNNERDFAEGLRRVYGYDTEQVNKVLALSRAAAKQWGLQEGRDPADWYKEKIASMERGSVGPSLNQIPQNELGQEDLFPVEKSPIDDRISMYEEQAKQAGLYGKQALSFVREQLARESKNQPQGAQLKGKQAEFGATGGVAGFGRGERGAQELFQGASDYQGQHTPPGPDSGAPLDDITGGGSIYPDDIYSNKAAQYYGHGEPALDLQTIAIIHSFRGRPNASVRVYRAVPNNITNAEKLAILEKQMAKYMARNTVPEGENPKGWYDRAYAERERLRTLPPEPETNIGINPGDWVTINRDYAEQHGETTLQGNYKITSKTVKAKDIFTNGDSIHEWGYWPEGSKHGQPLFQRKKASVEFRPDGKAILRAFEGADISSAIHELGHIYRRDMYSRLGKIKDKAMLGQLKSDIAYMEKWAGVKNGRWTVAAEEKFARGFERYMATGKAPSVELSRIFKQFAEWLKNVYREIRGSAIDVNVSPEMSGVFDRLFAYDYEILPNGQKVPKTKILDRARVMMNKAIEERGVPDSLERFFLNNPIRAYRGGVEMEEYADIPLRFKKRIGGMPLDERAAEAQAQGLIPEGVDAEKYARDMLTGIGQRGAMPQLMEFYDEALRELEYESQVPAELYQKARDIDTPEFKKWFGNSKVVDENGQPLVVYHGTEKAGFPIFDEYEIGKNTTASEGFYFTESKLNASTYSGSHKDKEAKIYGEDFEAKYQGESGIYPVFLSLQNPYIFDFEGHNFDGANSEGDYDGFPSINEIVDMAKKGGADGVIAENITDEGRYGRGYYWGKTTYVAFSSTQIKSATGNRGTFDPKDPNILHQEEQGKLEGISEKPITDLPESLYAQNRAMSAEGFIPATKRSVKDLIEGASQDASKLFVPISSVLRNINPYLKIAIRSHVYNVLQSTKRDMEAALPFLNGIKKMSPADQADFDLARKNSDEKRINALVKKYGLEVQYTRLRWMLDAIHKRAEAMGVDLGYTKDYHPRRIKDVKGFLQDVHKSPRWGEIQEIIAQKEEELRRPLQDDEKAVVINAYLRGYNMARIPLSKTGNMLSREVDVVDGYRNKFYHTSDEALTSYIEDVNKALETRRFFGKGKSEMGVDDIEQSVGAYVMKALDKGHIKPEDQWRLKDILIKFFKPKGMHGAWATFRNLEYVETMGNVISAITQLSDLGVAFYRSPLRALNSIARAVVGKSKIKLDDLGLDDIAEEFKRQPHWSAKLTNKFFKLGLMNKFDKLTAETQTNTIISKYRKQARNPEKGDFMRRMKAVFGEETGQIIEDLKSGKVTENVKYLALSELLDIQPKALSEMPEAYLQGGNGRLFYMLKTFQLRQLDMIRNETLKLMASPDLKTKAEGAKNLVVLSSFLFMAGVGVDELKDFLLNRETSFSDRVIDNTLKLAGLSKFTAYKARQYGPFRTAKEMVLPPTKMADAIVKDIVNAGDDKGLEVIASIPVFGKFYYWWFGKGAHKNDKKRKGSGSSFNQRPTVFK